MFRSLLVVFGLPPEWLEQTRPTATGGEQPVVPQTSPFQQGILPTRAVRPDVHLGQAGPATPSNRHGRPKDDLVIRDVLLDPTSGIRVRAEVHSELHVRVRNYPVPADGIYRLPDPSAPQGTTDRSALAGYGRRMTEVALHWLTKPGWNKAEALLLQTNRELADRVAYVWALASRINAADLLMQAGWLQGQGTIAHDLSGISPTIRQVVPRDMDYEWKPEVLADYLLNTLSATFAKDQAMPLVQMLNVLDQLHEPDGYDIPVVELEQTQLMHVYDAVIYSEIRKRIQETLWMLHNMRWMSVLQRIKYSVQFSVPESFRCARRGGTTLSSRQPSARWTMSWREIERWWRKRLLNPTTERVTSCDQTSKFWTKCCKYGGPELAHKYNAAWSELHNNLAMLEREIEQQIARW